MEPQNMADEIAEQVLDGFAEVPWIELERLCLHSREWWVMGTDDQPYVIRAWAHSDAAGLIVRVRVDTNGWTWTEPALGALLLEAEPDR